MHLLFRSRADPSLQKQKQQAAANAEGAGPKKKKVTAAQLRVQKGTSTPRFPFLGGLKSFPLPD